MRNNENPTTCEACFVVKLPVTCEICFEEKLPIESSIYKQETKCTQPHSFCKDCMTRHILYKIQAKTAVIGCPGERCNAMISPYKCRSLISRDSFVEWCDIMAETWIAGKDHRRADCPYQGCSEVVVDECKGGGRQECPRCKGVFCFDCGVKWSMNHPQDCRFEELVFLNAARQEDWKRCPNCRFFVQCTAGCSAITCRCGTAFCYKCGVQGLQCHCIKSEERIFRQRGRCCLIVLIVLVFSFVAFLIGKSKR